MGFENNFAAIPQMNERINDLEDRVTGISVCVCKLENESEPKSFLRLTKEASREVNDALIAIQDQWANELRTLTPLIERVEKLEKNLSGDYLLVATSKEFTDLKSLVHDFIKSANGRIEKIQNEFHSKLDVDLSKWKEYFSEYLPPKKPHKCPVCEGKGNSQGKTQQHPNYEFCMEYASCPTCEGKGIVWG